MSTQRDACDCSVTVSAPMVGIYEFGSGSKPLFVLRPDLTHNALNIWRAGAPCGMLPIVRRSDPLSSQVFGFQPSAIQLLRF